MFHGRHVYFLACSCSSSPERLLLRQYARHRSLVAPQPRQKDKTFNRRPVFITFESWEAESGIRLPCGQNRSWVTSSYLLFQVSVAGSGYRRDARIQAYRWDERSSALDTDGREGKIPLARRVQFTHLLRPFVRPYR